MYLEVGLILGKSPQVTSIQLLSCGREGEFDQGDHKSLVRLAFYITLVCRKVVVMNVEIIILFVCSAIWSVGSRHVFN